MADIAARPTTLRQTFRKFLVLSSLRGVGRILKARNSFLSVLWAVTVLSFLSVSLFQVITLIQNYFKYVTIKEQTIITKDSVPFPSLTLCNLQPFRPEAKKLSAKLDMITIDEFLNIMAIMPDFVADKSLAAYFANVLSTNVGYFENQERESIIKLGHDAKTFVERCQAKILINDSVRLQDCSDHLRLFVDPQYLNCYTVEHEGRGKVVELELTIFLDDYIVLNYSPLYANDINSQMHGMKMVIHEPKTYPDIESSRNAWDLQPGASYKFVLRTSIWRRKGPPYGRCADRDRTAAVITLEDNSTYNYDSGTCKALCIQEKILKHCGCKDSRLPFTTEQKLKYENVDYCSSLKNGDSTKIANLISCMDGTKLTSGGKVCTADCLEPCLQYDFQLYSTMSRWPHASFQLPLFQRRSSQMEKDARDKGEADSTDNYSIGVEGGSGGTGSGDENGEFAYKYTDRISPLDSHYEKINTIVQNAIANDSEEAKMEEARKMLLTSDLMQRNFIKIKVVRPSHDVMYVEEVPELGISSFLSGIGGAMNFWMGITLVVVMELVELVFDLFDLAFGEKNGKKRKAAHNNCDAEDKNSNEAVRV
ncbi:FMRFamide-activated amiloride-sensitive sodium channel-like isoform X1 [Lineus longissimus]|uniref:FMRFamide-activated amiloride-sensitive sodium channel-like isoform X1 n=1 Tax=Lineus longissimus TaxID=88925 RepID=UPI002B4F7572